MLSSGVHVRIDRICHSALGSNDVAVIASSAVPGLLPPAVLMMKNEHGEAEPFVHSGHTWRDGSLRIDIPIEAINYYVSYPYPQYSYRIELTRLASSMCVIPL